MLNEIRIGAHHQFQLSGLISGNEIALRYRTSADDVIAGAFEENSLIEVGPNSTAASAAIAEVDHAGDIGADEVALNEVAGCRGAEDVDTVVEIAADHVGGACGSGADGVVVRVLNEYAVAAVAEIEGAGFVGADEIAQYGISTDADISNMDAVRRVAGDDVAIPGAAVAADDIIRGIGFDPNAIDIRDGGRAGCIGADVVAANGIVGSAETGDIDTRSRVAGNDISLAGSEVADIVVGGTLFDPDAVEVGNRDRASGIGTDIVSDHRIESAASAANEDAVVDIAGDHIGSVGCRTANGAVVSVQEGDSGRITDRRGTGDVGTDVIARHRIRTNGNESNAISQVTGNHVPLGDRRAANGVISAGDVYADTIHVRQVGIAGGIEADDIVEDLIVVA